MDHKKIIIGSVVALVIIGLVTAGVLYKGFGIGDVLVEQVSNQEVVMGDPVDIVMDFYSPWLEAVKSNETDPYTSELISKKILSEGLRNRIMSTKGHADTEIDPVLCQTTKPERVTGRVVSEQENMVRVLVMAKEKELTAQSVFVLKRQNDGWFIDDIVCSLGEFELSREFSFEKEGFLLKSVPPPLNREYWHLVFEENGELGHFVPLFFGAETKCVSTSGEETLCSPDQFVDATRAHIFGQMTESGVEVKRLEFVKE